LFRQHFQNRSLAPVLVVIPAYNEAESLGRVLESIEPSACGLAVDVLVVDDGSGDRTMEVARAHAAHVVRLERNGGQGLAFRVGYQLAREHGARYIVTLDADGQWDPRGIPTVLQPLVDGEADFVLGSRVLGRSETDDAVRRAGVRFFAALVRLLTGVRVTDTSSGLRAMRAELTGRVRQEQAQYQAAELLIGAIYLGYRVTERPVLMRKRIGGESKKGHNVLYGLRYGRVVVGTWWRERRAARSSSVSRTTVVSGDGGRETAPPIRSKLAFARRRRLFLALLGLGLALRVVIAVGTTLRSRGQN
jgi:glycosyltransferase involved in cell wall biosynthesis